MKQAAGRDTLSGSVCRRQKWVVKDHRRNLRTEDSRIGRNLEHKNLEQI